MYIYLCVCFFYTDIIMYDGIMFLYSTVFSFLIQSSCRKSTGRSFDEISNTFMLCVISCFNCFVCTYINILDFVENI